MQCLSPSVYLDHWALRYFSENQHLADQLVKFVIDLSGTFCISLAIILEFTKISSKETANKANNILENIFPNIFFLESDPFAVIENEGNILKGDYSKPPHGDFNLLRIPLLLSPNNINPLSIRGLFQLISESELDKEFENVKSTILAKFDDLRKEALINSKFKKDVYRKPGLILQDRDTKIVMTNLLRSLILDSKMNLQKNDSIDMLHTIVPITYCDFVLLDKRWETFANQAINRLSVLNDRDMFATVYSQKKQGVLRFLNDLRLYNL